MLRSTSRRMRRFPLPQPIAEELYKARRRNETIVMDDVHQDVEVSSTRRVTGMAMLQGATVARMKHQERSNRQVCVVGGAKAIKRIWHEYKIRPNVVFAPNTDDVPSWCFNDELPTYVVRHDPLSINRELLSAELNDGFAAEFPIVPQAPIAELVDTAEQAENSVGASTTKVDRMLVLDGLNIPGNVGALVKFAKRSGFDTVFLNRCADAYNEKVLRASEGMVLDPKLKIFNVKERDDVPTATVLQTAAAVHNLLPIFAMPSQEAEPAFKVAARLHAQNAAAKEASQRPLGPMLMLGSEARGLEELLGEWQAPVQLVSLEMQNALINSLNVSVAGSVLMHHFRPQAEAEFASLRAKGIALPEESNPSTDQIEDGGFARAPEA